MNCHECEGLLQRQLDGEAVASPDLERHLADCGSCRSQFAAGQRLLGGIRHMTAPMPPSGLADQVVRRVLQDRLNRRVRLRWAAATAALAACLLLAFWFYENRTRDIQPLPVAAGPGPEKGVAKNPGPPETASATPKALDHSASALVDKTRKDVDVMGDVTAALGAPRMDQSRSETEPKLARTRAGMASGLQTVSAVTRRGVSFMLRDNAQNKKNGE